MAELTVEERFATPIAEKYRLDRVLGDGGFGIVYAGEHEWTGRPIAVKVMDPALARQSEFVKRFLREARVAARLSHPHVVDVLDMGRDDDGTVYLVLELLDGEDLAKVLKRNQKLDAKTVLAHLLPVMDALADAHTQGIIHRDLKPANIFLSIDKRGRTVPKLLDFGIAKDLSATGMTQSGQVWGTPHFMSPEQAMGLVDIGPQIDVWAMGVVMYRSLSGEMPYSASTPRLLVQKLLAGPPAPLSEVAEDVPVEIARCVDRALSHDTDFRYQDMGEMLVEMLQAASALSMLPPALEELLDGRAIGGSSTRVSAAADVEAQILGEAEQEEAEASAPAKEPGDDHVSGVMERRAAETREVRLPSGSGEPASLEPLFPLASEVDEGDDDATEISEGLHERLEAKLRAEEAAAGRATIKDFDLAELGITAPDVESPEDRDVPTTRVAPMREERAPDGMRWLVVVAVVLLFIAGLVTGTLLTIGQLGG